MSDGDEREMLMKNGEREKEREVVMRDDMRYNMIMIWCYEICMWPIEYTYIHRLLTLTCYHIHNIISYIWYLWYVMRSLYHEDEWKCFGGHTHTTKHWYVYKISVIVSQSHGSPSLSMCARGKWYIIVIKNCMFHWLKALQ